MDGEAGKVTMGRAFAIGDIHGCCRTFQRLLFEVIGLEKADSLYLLGDYIDRGPDSKGVIEQIMALQANGYVVQPIRGNHEQLLLNALTQPTRENMTLWLDYGGHATLKSYGVEHPEELPLAHINFFKKLPFYCASEKHIFVHAGIECNLENPFTCDGEDAMLWSRTKMTDPDKCEGYVLVGGHTPLSLADIEESIASPHIRLDNGCVYGEVLPGFGNLVALELNTGELFVQEKIDP